MTSHNDLHHGKRRVRLAGARPIGCKVGPTGDTNLTDNSRPRGCGGGWRDTGVLGVFCVQKVDPKGLSLKKPFLNTMSPSGLN